MVPASKAGSTWLLKAWGWLVVHGKNHVLADWAVELGFGMNKRGKPMLFSDRLAEITRAMDWSGVVSTARSISDRKERLTWLLEDHAYLPDAMVAGLSGYSVPGVRAARKTTKPRNGRAWRQVVHPDDLEPAF
ncbi:hypothetical protein IAI58_11610 [Roseomonas marmotae]|nr:hypothetical protein IAI58_11610 [Roseomonas marmotae]